MLDAEFLFPGFYHNVAINSRSGEAEVNAFVKLRDNVDMTLGLYNRQVASVQCGGRE